MSDTVAELATRFRLSDPKPARCAACFCSAGPEVRFVDFDSAIDRGAFVAPDGAHGVLDSIDDLHLCEACVSQAAEILAFKAELHRRQLTEIRRLEVESAHWKATCGRLKRELDQQIESGLGKPRNGRRG